MYTGVAAIVMLFLHFNFEETAAITLKDFILIAIMGLTCHGVSYILWGIGVKKGNFKFLSVLAYANPILSVILLISFGYAELSQRVIIASMLVALGGLIAGVRVKIVGKQHLVSFLIREIYYSNFSNIVERNLYRLKY